MPRLFESIVAASSRGAAEFADALPAIVLTCIDPRLNALVPRALGLPEESFIWLRNAGNLITGPLSSTVRSLALACVVKGGREIAIIGHTDCQVCKTTMLQITERFRALGVERARLPENLLEYFGLSASERNNVLRATEFVRASPLIGPRVPVHGLLLDLQTARLEWVVNGYQTLATQTSTAPASIAVAPSHAASAGLSENWAALGKFDFGEMKTPEGKIGEIRAAPATSAAAINPLGSAPAPTPTPASAPRPTSGPTRPALPSTAADSRSSSARSLPATTRYSVKGDDGRIYGPFTADLMLGWLAEGRITLDTPTQPLGQHDWKPLATFLAQTPRRSGSPPPIIRY